MRALLELARCTATCYPSADQKTPKLLAAASVPLSHEPQRRRVIVFFPSSLLIAWWHAGTAGRGGQAVLQPGSAAQHGLGTCL